MEALLFTLYLDEPVLATRPLSGEPNSAVSLPYIPGSMLCGALVRLAEQRLPVDISASSRWRRCFLDGGVRFLNAYPQAVETGERMLPRPLSWFVEKDQASADQGTLSDWAVATSEIKRPKPPTAEFCAIGELGVNLGTPARHIQVHNLSINRREKTAGTSQVFRYESLAAGQRFRAVVLFEQSEDLNLFRELLTGACLLLGGSHTGGYGQVSVHDVKPEPGWTETCPSPRAGNQIVITLLSDTLLTAPDGRYDLALARALGLPAPAANHKAWFHLCQAGGFNRTWGLPLPQQTALEAGSVFCFPASDASDEVFEQAARQGIGQRCVEGFGRIAIDWQSLPEHAFTRLPAAAQQKPTDLSESSKSMARSMAARRLRVALEEGLTTCLDPDILTGELAPMNLPSPAQLSRVRLACRQALAAGNLAAITQHIDSLSSARRDWEKSRYHHQPLLAWILQQCNLSETDFRIAFGLGLGRPLTPVAGEPAALNGALQTEFCARRIDGVMKFAIEQKKKEKGAQG